MKGNSLIIPAPFLKRSLLVPLLSCLYKVKVHGLPYCWWSHWHFLRHTDLKTQYPDPQTLHAKLAPLLEKSSVCFGQSVQADINPSRPLPNEKTSDSEMLEVTQLGQWHNWLPNRRISTTLLWCLPTLTLFLFLTFSLVFLVLISILLPVLWLHTDGTFQILTFNMASLSFQTLRWLPIFYQFSPNCDLAHKVYHNLVLTHVSKFISRHFSKTTRSFIQSWWAYDWPTETGLGSPFTNACCHWFP